MDVASHNLYVLLLHDQNPLGFWSFLFFPLFIDAEKIKKGGVLDGKNHHFDVPKRNVDWNDFSTDWHSSQ